jgi:pyruvate dehydrogenase E1 component
VATTVPNCVSYDPTFAYELAVIIHDGMRRMFVEQENIFYYLTVMNENYPQPALPKGVAAGILKGAYLLTGGGRGKDRVTLLGSGTILREVQAAAQILENDYGVCAEVFSVTSFSELRREALEVERWNLLHPDAPVRVPYVQQLFQDREGPVIAATDYVRTVPDQIRQWVGGRYVTLGTDGYGRSDSRAALRKHFEVDRNFIAFAALKSLADEGKIDQPAVTHAMRALGVDPCKPVPWKV